MTRAHVVVPAFECYSALVRCLGSLLAQRFDDLSVVVIDDASSDTRQAELVRSVNRFDGWRGVVNDQRVGALANIVSGVRGFDVPSDAVVILVDGDDWLPDRDTIRRIVDVYDADENVWLTYGSYEPFPQDVSCHPAEPYPAEVIEQRSFRQWATVFNHPLTFRKFLFDELTDADLRLASGEFVPGIYDEALMYPMLEIAGPNHRFMPDVNYVYNTANPLSCHWVMLDEIVAAGQELRQRPPRGRMVWSGGRLVAVSEVTS